MDMPEVSLPPQSLTMEASWVSFWFQRLLKRQAELEREAQEQNSPSVRETIFIADRSPYSAVFYAGEQGPLLEPIIRAQIQEMESLANIRVLCVNVQVAEDVLWKRINQRLEREPWRRKYKEHNYDWMLTTLEFYNRCHWDYVFDNSKNAVGAINELMHACIQRLAADVPRFTETCPHDIRMTLKENEFPSTLTGTKRVSALPPETQALMEQLSLQ